MSNSEIINSNPGGQEQVETEQSPSLEPNFDTHMKRTRGERVQRFVELAKARGGEDGKEKSVDEALNEMDSATALDFLQHINSQLRNEKVSKKSEIYGDKTHRMMVGSETLGGTKNLIAPEPELQKELFNEYFEAIKKIDDKEKKALLAYYAINNLHLFSDGNGRTSRAVYLLIKNGNVSNANDVVAHNDNIKIRLDEDMDSDDGSGRENFITENGIIPVEEINDVANMFLQEQMVKDGLLSEELADKKIYIYSVRERGKIVSVMMSDKNKEGLSEEEIKCLNYAMSDGGGGVRNSTLAGLTIAAVLSQKGSAKAVIERSLKDENRLPIRVNFDYDSSDNVVREVKKTFAGWTSDDYKKTIEMYEDIKRRQCETIISFFVEDKKLPDGKNVADWAMNK
ncbi:MAG: Fic family protein [Candidatus Saccharibacteria bacterium]|nr:Fic family protein [Candidatus Saccharibacteria bacterium]